MGKPAPDFDRVCVERSATRRRRLADYAGKWLVVVFYPRDFSFVCPTELTAFSARIEDFRQRNCELLAVSVDSVQSHQAWLEAEPEDGGVGLLRFPLASDPDGAAARAYRVWIEEKAVANRGLFVIDPDGILQFSVMHNLRVGRSVEEVMRVVDALQTGQLCPASWTRADGTLDPEEALQPGRVLGHYRIDKPLGTGTFGAVFAAWDLRLQRMVAVKILRRAIGESRTALLAEARLAAALTHPNVCTIYAVEEEDGLPLIAMEYLPGRPLASLLDKPLPLHLVRTWGRQIATALASAHASEVVHGDLKPANIIFTADGSPKVVDFGLARTQQPYHEANQAAQQPQRKSPEAATADATPTDSTTDSTTVDLVHEGGGTPTNRRDSELPETVQLRGVRQVTGTPAYMSPEQARGQASTSASDVFALGLILYEMVTGQRAVRGRSLDGLLETVERAEFAGPRAAELPAPLDELVRHMLTRDAAQRPSMETVIGYLLDG